MVGFSIGGMATCWNFSQLDGVTNVLNKLILHIVNNRPFDIRFINHADIFSIGFSFGYWICFVFLLGFLSLVLWNIVKDSKHKDDISPEMKSINKLTRAISNQTTNINDLTGKIDKLIETLSKKSK